MHMGTFITHFHTHIMVYIQTLLVHYIFPTCVRVCHSAVKTQVSSLAALANEFALIYPSNARNIISISFYHLILPSLLMLPLFSLNPCTSWWFIKFFHTDGAYTLSSHLLCFSFPAIFHPSFFSPDSYWSLISWSDIQSHFSTFPSFSFDSVFPQNQDVMSRTSFCMRG